jgi:hypothetical protein
VSQPVDPLGSVVPDPVGEVLVGGTADRPTFLTLPAGHVEAVRASARDVLRQAGLRPGDVLVLVGTLADCAVLRPFGQAAADLGCPYVAGDPSRFATPQLIEFFRQFRPSVVVGLDEEIVVELDRAGTTVDSVFDEATIFAAPAAGRRIGPGPVVRDWVEWGPVVGVGCPAGGTHLLVGGFRPTTADGRVHLLGADGELLHATHDGTVEDGPCGCGLDLPRLVPAVGRAVAS